MQYKEDVSYNQFTRIKDGLKTEEELSLEDFNKYVTKIGLICAKISTNYKGYSPKFESTIRHLTKTLRYLHFITINDIPALKENRIPEILSLSLIDNTVHQVKITILECIMELTLKDESITSMFLYSDLFRYLHDYVSDHYSVRKDLVLHIIGNILFDVDESKTKALMDYFPIQYLYDLYTETDDRVIALKIIYCISGYTRFTLSDEDIEMILDIAHNEFNIEDHDSTLLSILCVFTNMLKNNQFEDINILSVLQMMLVQSITKYKKNIMGFIEEVYKHFVPQLIFNIGMIINYGTNDKIDSDISQSAASTAYTMVKADKRLKDIVAHSGMIEKIFLAIPVSGHEQTISLGGIVVEVANCIDSDCFRYFFPETTPISFFEICKLLLDNYFTNITPRVFKGLTSVFTYAINESNDIYQELLGMFNEVFPENSIWEYIYVDDDYVQNTGILFMETAFKIISED